jgi:FKBP-type peptidyl-prolyl cis-trans isomerase 2
MRPVEIGDRVEVHYVKRLQDGSVATSRDHSPIELMAGTEHRRLPGLGLALIGMVPGERVTVKVAPEHAYGPRVEGRVRRCARTRFSADQPLTVGKRVRILDRQGRTHQVRILEVGNRSVLVDTNHRFAGQTLEIEVELLRIQNQPAGPGISLQGTEAAHNHPSTQALPAKSDPTDGRRRDSAPRDRSSRADPGRDVGGEA